MLCEGKLIRDTGICAGNYKYFSSKGDADSFFLGKAFHDFDRYSVVRGDGTSKNGYNVACVHVDIPYGDAINCDYVSYKYDNGGRWFHCFVTDREYVNEKSTRIYFSIDYIATFYDTIKLGKCFIERTHVDDDWEGGDGQANYHTANKYLKPEPVDTVSYNRPELLFTNPFNTFNAFLNVSAGEYCISSAISKEGKLDGLKISYQAGANVSGYLYNGTRPKITEILNGYVTTMNKVINQYNSFNQYIDSIYFCPKIVAGDRSGAPIIYPVNEINLPAMVLWNKLPKIRHAKTLNYIKFCIRSNGGQNVFGFNTYDLYVHYDVIFTGGENGRASILFQDSMGFYDGTRVDTKSWVKVNPSGATKQNQYDLLGYRLDGFIDFMTKPITEL